MTFNRPASSLPMQNFLKALGIAVVFLGSVAPACGEVAFIGSVSTGVVSDPWLFTETNTTFGTTGASFLDIYNGGTVSSSNRILIGSEPAQYVQVDVRDTGSSLSARELHVGNGYLAWMSVSNGGAVSVTNDANIEGPFGGTTTLLVTDPGSQLTVGDAFSVSSNAEFIVAGGASVETGANLTVSQTNLVATIIGDATVQGSGSTWTDHNFLRVTNLLVEDGGHFISTNTAPLRPFEFSGKAILDGGTITAEQITTSGSGWLDFRSGTLTLNQSGLTVGSPGLLGSDVYIDASSTIDVSGEVVVDSTATLFVEGALVSSALTNYGSLILEGATLEQAVTSPAGSTIDVIGNVTFNGLVTGAGGISGSGTATFNGGYSPGDSPAVVPLETDLALGALNSLNIELAGTGSGEFDQLMIAGDASLDGTLNVSLIDGFALDPQQAFTILDIEGELTGQFLGLGEGERVGGYNGIDLLITYAAGDGNDVALYSTAVPEPSAGALLASALLALLLVRKHRYMLCFKPCLGAMVLILLCVSPSRAAIQAVGSLSPGVDITQLTGPWNPESLQVGFGTNGPGLLVISDTSSLGHNHDTVNVDTNILVGSNVSGTIVVTGSGAQLTGDVFKIGNAAPGLFFVSNGASVVTGEAQGEARIGGDTLDGTGRAVISESGSNWTHYDLHVTGLGDLSVAHGASVDTTNLATLQGPTTVAGSGSVWNVGGLVLSSGAGSVVVSEGGQVNVLGELYLEQFMGGTVFTENFAVRLVAEDSISIQGGTFSTNSFISLVPGGVDFDYGTLNLSDSGLVVGATGLIGAAVDIDAGSAINLSDGVTVEAGASLTVAGTLSSANLNNNGRLTLLDTTLDQPMVSPQGSTIDVIGNVTFNGLVSGAGGIFGSGTAIFNGGYNPGDSPAVVGVENSIAFGSGNTLGIELGGLTAGEFDQLQVGGDATLNGTLDVGLLGPFAPEAGQEFMILEAAGSVSGQFTGLDEGGLVGSFGGQDLFITYAAGNGNDVALYTSPVPEPSALVLAGLGLLALGGFRRKRALRAKKPAATISH